jgi:hypothetical protein
MFHLLMKFFLVHYPLSGVSARRRVTGKVLIIIILYNVQQRTSLWLL